MGAKKFFLEDLKREFVTELIYPAVQANCIYEVCSFSISRSLWISNPLHRTSTCWARPLHVPSLPGA